MASRSWRLLRKYLVALPIVAAMGLISLDMYLQSYNEVSGGAAPGAVKTKVGADTSLRPMGTLPMFLVLALNKRPTRDSCLADPARDLMDWDNFDSANDVEVCMFRVLARARNIDAIDRILAVNGFAGHPSTDRGSNPAPNARLGQNCADCDARCGRFIPELGLPFLSAYAYSVSIVLRQGRILDVELHPLSL